MFVTCFKCISQKPWNSRFHSLELQKCLSYNHVGKCRLHCQTCSQTDLPSVKGSFSLLFSSNTNVTHGNHLTFDPRCLILVGGAPGNQPPPLSLLPISLCFVLMNFSLWKDTFSKHSWGFPWKLSHHSSIQSGFRTHQHGLILAF